MSQSLSQIYIHLVFGTKNRFPFLNNAIREKLHIYIDNGLKDLDSPAVTINSVFDHIHILLRLSKTVTISQIAKEIKVSSSKYIKHLDGGVPNFQWQKGYGAFSVSSSKVDVVKRYIQNQKKHHLGANYKEEMETFFEHYNINDYDSKYFWS
ncbi:MAG: IS200/IS605 family transposase [Bacteroidales bacterium]|nr:IS200/IS605 family transposase [Bacteroidales bacterium]